MTSNGSHTLEILKIIERQFEGKVKFLVDRTLHWRPGSTLYDALFFRAANEFLTGDFAKENSGHFVFLTGELSENSLSLLQKKTKEFENEVTQIIALDATLAKKTTVSSGVLIALRPWVLSVFETWVGQSRESLSSQ